MPQVVELYAGVYKRPGVPIYLMNLNQMNLFLDRVEATLPPNSKIAHQSHGNNTPQVLFAYDPTLLPRICRLYEIDLDMLQQLGGLVPTLCSS